MRARELVLCGLPAVRARFARQPESIRRLFFDSANAPKLGDVCRSLAQNRRVYRCIDAAELEKVAGSVHHGGVVAVVDAALLYDVDAASLERWVQRRDALLVLDNIGNAHNLGAIARSAAFFGVPRLILSGDADRARPGDAAYRVAEGGLEWLDLRVADDTAALLRQLTAAGYEVVGATARGGSAAIAGVGPGPRALVFGNEERGLSPAVCAACTRLVTLPGRGRVESLNVSVAAGLMIWELFART